MQMVQLILAMGGVFAVLAALGMIAFNIVAAWEQDGKPDLPTFARRLTRGLSRS
ncbi:hypothetical protein [Burkholderia vietnamiensis]|uniref:hypothetical protein n=1 Tax=Burkholderia vietnamiensis TaxID=60552 RepID=UPI001CF49FBE|nr:hypothetical protein [Burkholderia vietnamiensis]MCA8448931.1 hypothetical protein [Burkholderia vietnamiensis]